MTNHYQILGVSQNTTREELQAAFEQKWSHWQKMQSNPHRAAEARQHLEQLETAYQKALQQLESVEGGLEFISEKTLRYVSAGLGTASNQSIDHNSCPNCSSNENPNDARYCINCQYQLFQPCPKCDHDLVWYQKGCHYCGINIEEYIETKKVETAAEEIERHRESIRLKQQKIVELQASATDLQDASKRLLYNPFKLDSIERELVGSSCKTQIQSLGLSAIFLPVLWLSLFIPSRILKESEFLFTILFTLILSFGFLLVIIAQKILILRPIAKSKIQECEQEISRLKHEIQNT